MSATEVAPDARTSESGTSGKAERGAGDDTTAHNDIGWLRAVLSGLAVLIVGFAGALGGANLILTKALGLTRDARQWLATALFLAVVIVLAWALRWLQRRGLI